MPGVCGMQGGGRQDEHGRGLQETPPAAETAALRARATESAPDVLSPRELIWATVVQGICAVPAATVAALIASELNARLSCCNTVGVMGADMLCLLPHRVDPLIARYLLSKCQEACFAWGLACLREHPRLLPVCSIHLLVCSSMAL